MVLRFFKNPTVFHTGSIGSIFRTQNKFFSYLFYIQPNILHSQIYSLMFKIPNINYMKSIRQIIAKHTLVHTNNSNAEKIRQNTIQF